MTCKDDRAEQATELRERAEQIFLKKADAPQEHLEALLSDKERRTLHELRVHQIELEMQNEELRRAQAELEGARVRYFDLYDLAPVGYCTISEQGLFLEANLTAATLLGMARSELVKQSVSRFIHEEDRIIFFLHRKQLFETGDSQRFELRMVPVGGTVLWAHLTATVAQDGDGGPVCRVVISNVTERKQAEEALQKANERLEIHVAERTDQLSRALASLQEENAVRVKTEAALREKEQYLQSIIDTSPECIMLLARDGSLLMMNRPGLNMIDADSLGQVQGKVIADLVMEEYHRQFIALTEEAFRGESGILEFELKSLKDRRLWVETHIAPYRNEKNEIIALLGITRDITRRKQAEAALQESRAHYKDLFSSMQEGFSLLEIISDADGKPADYRIMEVNPAFESLFAMNRDMLIGRSLQEVFPQSEEYWQKNLANVALTGEPVILENYFDRLDRYFEEHAYKPAQGRIALLVSDLTERRKFHEEMEKGQRLESLGVLAGGIAHDFNNILTAIFGNISLAKLYVGEEHKAAKRLDACEHAMSRARDLTRQLLTFARGGEPIKGIVDTERLIREAVSFSVRGSNCTSVFHPAKDLWHVEADAGQLHQALNNLVINAIQAMPDGGYLTVNAVNEMVKADDGHALPSGRYVKISVSDQGCGIPPDIHSKIFDPYFTTKPAGTGLGLTSAYSIIKRHGGSIHLSSRPGTGTTFDILLPAVDEIPGESTAVPDPLPATMPGKSILVMDDEEIIRSMASVMLEELGYTVATCAEGTEAVKLYRESKEKGEAFAAVLLDMTVPGGMGGKDAAKHIRSIDPDAVLVISSGYSVDLEIAERDNVFFSGSVAKPYNLHELARELSRVIHRT
jgi:PAS domain S-box-containing protein